MKQIEGVRGLPRNLETLKKSLRIALFLTIADIVLSLVVSKAFSGSIEALQVSAVFGNLALILAMILFLFGGAFDLTATAKWSSAMRMLGISKKEWKERDSKMAERRAIVLIISGVILLGETIVLAIITAN
jgi:uncharacterized protein YacL